jgi:hypothetical protein
MAGASGAWSNTFSSRSESRISVLVSRSWRSIELTYAFSFLQKFCSWKKASVSGLLSE